MRHVPGQGEGSQGQEGQARTGDDVPELSRVRGDLESRRARLSDADFAYIDEIVADAPPFSPEVWSELRRLIEPDLVKRTQPRRRRGADAAA
ncbi:hypothetical protein H0B56_12290 [Haloechinothrix sp. YIM 98757]|uniref:Uncharacterized protein n=1 Tax=Haloechinothrix aidingensis TaxID=2752311 RepID=A0A838AAP9_9PSEU|nr:hypothetical protein [Haloechinothrix aidingensis]MBA0126322.1 hypothetical protein [Haloechinothrix aidingensis]